MAIGMDNFRMCWGIDPFGQVLHVLVVLAGGCVTAGPQGVYSSVPLTLQPRHLPTHSVGAGQVEAQARNDRTHHARLGGIVAFEDHFSCQSPGYRRYRPTYPDGLFNYLARLAPRRERAWDCATGTGQAAVGLSGYFDTVLASDPSQTQVRQARSGSGVRYLVGTAEEPPFRGATMDLVVVAQALHWFDVDASFAPVGSSRCLLTVCIGSRHPSTGSSTISTERSSAETGPPSGVTSNRATPLCRFPFGRPPRRRSR